MPTPILPLAEIDKALAGAAWFTVNAELFPTFNPPTNVLVAVVDVALKYGAPINVPASIPPENVEVAVEPRAMATVVVGASLLSALSSHALPKMEDERA